jgi:elongation factor P--beta-lysine ligase
MTDSAQSPTYGNALGVDRLVMLRAGVKDIDAVHLFPPSGRFS